MVGHFFPVKVGLLTLSLVFGGVDDDADSLSRVWMELLIMMMEAQLPHHQRNDENKLQSLEPSARGWRASLSLVCRFAHVRPKTRQKEGVVVCIQLSLRGVPWAKDILLLIMPWSRMR